MSEGREHQHEAWDLDNPNTQTLLAAESLRRDSAAATAPLQKGDDRVSVFWRIFGGTLLSIAGLVCITAYQQFTNTFTEFRNSLNHLNESSRDLVKNDDFNTRFTSVWSSIKDLQTADAGIVALKERSALLEQQLKTLQDQANSRSASVSLGLKELETTLANVTALKDKMTLLEQLVKAGDDERKDLNREIQTLRERLAILEGKQAATAAPAARDK
jgi:predicted nuclease with TOPRIM domain